MHFDNSLLDLRAATGQQRELVNVQMRDVQLEYTDLEGRVLDASGSLGNMVVRDMNPDVREEYKELLGLDVGRSQTSLVSVEYHWWGDDAAKSAAGVACDSKMHMKFSPMRFVYTHQLTMELMDYFYEGVLGAWFNQPAHLAAEVEEARTDDEAAQAASEAGQEAVLQNLVYVDMERPLIVVPQNPRSEHHVRVYADRISVRHTIDVENAVDHKTVKLSGMGLTDGSRGSGAMLKKCVDMEIMVDTRLGE